MTRKRRNETRAGILNFKLSRPPARKRRLSPPAFSSPMPLGVRFPLPESVTAGSIFSRCVSFRLECAG